MVSPIYPFTHSQYPNPKMFGSEENNDFYVSDAVWWQEDKKCLQRAHFVLGYIYDSNLHAHHNLIWPPINMTPRAGAQLRAQRCNCNRTERPDKPKYQVIKGRKPEWVLAAGITGALSLLAAGAKPPTLPHSFCPSNLGIYCLAKAIVLDL